MCFVLVSACRINVAAPGVGTQRQDVLQILVRQFEFSLSDNLLQ